jgi:heme/copper-type cytochrome/quinol oxidase subunit 2
MFTLPKLPKAILAAGFVGIALYLAAWVFLVHVFYCNTKARKEGKPMKFYKNTALYWVHLALILVMFLAVLGSSAGYLYKKRSSKYEWDNCDLSPLSGEIDPLEAAVIAEAAAEAM